MSLSQNTEIDFTTVHVNSVVPMHCLLIRVLLEAKLIRLCARAMKVTLEMG
jgi:hypothetical protein